MAGSGFPEARQTNDIVPSLGIEWVEFGASLIRGGAREGENIGNFYSRNFIMLTMNCDVEVCTFNDIIYRGHMTSIVSRILRLNAIDQ